jgi:hypothetical protein
VDGDGMVAVVAISAARCGVGKISRMAGTAPATRDGVESQTFLDR